MKNLMLTLEEHTVEGIEKGDIRMLVSKKRWPASYDGPVYISIGDEIVGKFNCNRIEKLVRQVSAKYPDAPWDYTKPYNYYYTLSSRLTLNDIKTGTMMTQKELDNLLIGPDETTIIYDVGQLIRINDLELFRRPKADYKIEQLNESYGYLED